MIVVDAADIRQQGIHSVAVSAVFSPVNPQLEEQAAAILRDEISDLAVTLSHEIGRIGLLERENAAIINACLHDLAVQIVASFNKALTDLNIHAPSNRLLGDRSLKAKQTESMR